MVIMANGIARGRVRKTTTSATESRRMPAILQQKVDRDMQPWFIACLFDIGYPLYGQFKPVKIRFPLTSIT